MYERDHPDDNRPRNAVKVARRYARGESTKEELAAAADAVDAAARAAARAAWDAARAAWDAVDAARAAARAAWDAAFAVDAAARDAERHWQTARLMEILGVQKEGT
jgi:Tfp pilus assembly protein PilW